jgi:hypothetical protein
MAGRTSRAHVDQVVEMLRQPGVFELLQQTPPDPEGLIEAGRLTPDQRIQRMHEALAELRRRGALPDLDGTARSGAS